MGVLNGLKVLDFTTLLPGPFGSMMLADMGADVVKVESPNREDLSKYIPPMIGEVSAVYAQLNRSKKSLALDLKQDEAREIIFKLIEEYDIIIEQFRPGVMDRLGIGYETLKEVNPSIIYCSLTGYGQTGPLRNKAGHDINYLALSGAASYSSRKNQAPVPAGIPVADIGGGSMPVVIGILAAVYHRTQTGEGQHIDVSMMDNIYAYNALSGSGYLAGGEDPEAESLLLNGGTFYDYYETKDGRYFSVGGVEPKFQKELCALLGEPALLSLSGSTKTEDQLQFKEKVKSAFKEKTFDEWLVLLGDDFDGCVEPVLKFSETVNHPQIKAREMIVPVAKLDGGTQDQIAFPIKFSNQSASYRFAGVQTGTHTNEVLKNAGWNDEKIAELTKKGLFG
ncbi:alpha-methylacyl-CoA racemase [Neobacillus niacini]|uniref:CaiB/BaiF CoA transferase family protein n=1 Tax=Neobacillus niacini TaxID=86668 RepID=UPI00278527FE|nr:CaiB/BaiF CoA-transferase family protein [Neobacillus niacini]MDQ1005329.1 alpha-methylacyl-CoA racemase [Neobacillus niacini]